MQSSESASGTLGKTRPVNYLEILNTLEEGPCFRKDKGDIAGTVASMTESDPGVESEKNSHNTLG
jgi:hypothetical protein